MDFEVKDLLPNSIYSDIFGISKRENLLPFLNKTVVITGAAKGLGFYLSCLLLLNNELKNTNTRIVAVDTDDKIFAKYGKLTYRKDIEFFVSRDYSYMGALNADYIIHTQDFRELDGYDAVSNLFDFITKSNTSAVIAFDSSVYGEVYNGKTKISEDDIFGYLDYSKADSFGTQLCRMAMTLAVKLARDNKADIKSAIMSEVYCAESKRYAEIFEDARKKRGVTVDQSERPHSAIYIADAVSALLKVLLKGIMGEAYNIASNDIISPVIIAEKCSEYLYGGELKVTYKGKQAKLSYMDSNLKIFDNTKLYQLGFTPEFNLQSGISRSLNILSEKGGES